ncbi:MAG: amidohydrolase family protein [Planctomycetes bacterium]|nr:amidohydrolase family protein [Planctomycetota bacterium]
MITPIMVGLTTDNQDRRLRGRAVARGVSNILACTVFLVASMPADALPGEDGGLVVVKARRVITVSGEEFSPGTIVIEAGKIKAVGGDIEYEPSAKVIRASHETVMPGFVLPRTRYGLTGYQRSGVHGDQRAETDVYLSELNLTDLVEAGYTVVCYVPSGSGIPGSATAYRTAGPDDARLLAPSAYLDVVVNLGAKEKDTLRKALKKAKEEIEKVEQARKEWDEAQKKKAEEAEKKGEKNGEGETPEDDGNENGGEEDGKVGRGADGDNDNDNGSDEPTDGEDATPAEEEFEPPEIDPKHQPLVDLIQKEEGALMMVRLRRASDLHHLDDVLKPYDDLAYVVHLTAGRATDFHHVVDSLGERNARVVLSPYINLMPQTTFRYNLMARLAAAGCETSVLPRFDSRIEYRRVRERLSDLVRAGLDRAEAVKSLTLHPARAVGLGDRLGSIEEGKDADLVFLDGDPLDPHARVTRVMILGEIVWSGEDK